MIKISTLNISELIDKLQHAQHNAAGCINFCKDTKGCEHHIIISDHMRRIFYAHDDIIEFLKRLCRTAKDGMVEINNE